MTLGTHILICLTITNPTNINTDTFVTKHLPREQGVPSIIVVLVSVVSTGSMVTPSLVAIVLPSAALARIVL